MSAVVSEVAQNRSGELTHPMGRTRSMHSRVEGSASTGGTTYAKAPTWLGRRGQRGNVSDTSHLERRTGPSSGSASQIFCTRRARHDPNWMAFGFEVWMVEALTEGVESSGAAEESQIRRGLRLGWSTEARHEMRRRVAK